MQKNISNLNLKVKQTFPCFHCLRKQAVNKVELTDIDPETNSRLQINLCLCDACTGLPASNLAAGKKSVLKR